jgi:DNA-binding NtrC family response regulator
MDQSNFVSSPKKFLLIGSSLDVTWAPILRDALNPLGLLESISESEILLSIQQKHYDLIIIDAAMVNNSEDIVASLYQKQPNIPIVVVTNSPTWQRARRAFLAGATDYVRKSLDANTLLTIFQRILIK